MKRIFIIATLVVALGGVGVLILNAYSEEPLTDLQMQNIEALSDSEQDGCDNFNGYRRILDGNEKVYDCCYKEQIGRGKDDCKRW